MYRGMLVALSLYVKPGRNEVILSNYTLFTRYIDPYGDSKELT
jgi:hypothetical protein